LAGLLPKTGHVVCSWLGNSPRIAQQSYLLVTENDFTKAGGMAKVVMEKQGKWLCGKSMVNFN
jgi:hypothetical protein